MIWNKDSLPQTARSNPSPSQPYRLGLGASQGSSRSFCQTQMSPSQSCPEQELQHMHHLASHIEWSARVAWQTGVYLLIWARLSGLFQHHSSIALWATKFLPPQCTSSEGHRHLYTNKNTVQILFEHWLHIDCIIWFYLVYIRIPCFRSFVVAWKYCETWAGPLCSISQGRRWTGTRCASPTDDTWTWMTFVLLDML